MEHPCRASLLLLAHEGRQVSQALGLTRWPALRLWHTHILTGHLRLLLLLLVLLLVVVLLLLLLMLVPAGL